MRDKFEKFLDAVKFLLEREAASTHDQHVADQAKRHIANVNQLYDDYEEPANPLTHVPQPEPLEPAAEEEAPVPEADPLAPPAAQAGDLDASGLAKVGEPVAAESIQPGDAQQAPVIETSRVPLPQEPPVVS